MALSHVLGQSTNDAGCGVNSDLVEEALLVCMQVQIDGAVLHGGLVTSGSKAVW